MAAATAADVAEDTASVYSGKLTLYVFLTCGVAATGGLIIGYDIGISGKHAIYLIYLLVYMYWLEGIIRMVTCSGRKKHRRKEQC
jgi:hypothetical protein